MVLRKTARRLNVRAASLRQQFSPKSGAEACAEGGSCGTDFVVTQV